MEGRKHLAAIRQYCDYIERHLANVETSWKTLSAACTDMRFIYDDCVWGSIDEDVRHHDLSKFSPEEFIQYQRCFFPVEGAEKESLGSAWKHHQAENSHHWQNWARREPRNPYEHEVHCVHMVLDWMAMGLEFDNTAESYYDAHREHIDIPEWAQTFLREIFNRLRLHKEAPPADPPEHKAT